MCKMSVIVLKLMRLSIPPLLYVNTLIDFSQFKIINKCVHKTMVLLWNVH